MIQHEILHQCLVPAEALTLDHSLLKIKKGVIPATSSGCCSSSSTTSTSTHQPHATTSAINNVNADLLSHPPFGPSSPATATVATATVVKRCGVLYHVDIPSDVIVDDSPVPAEEKQSSNESTTKRKNLFLECFLVPALMGTTPSSCLNEATGNDSSVVAREVSLYSFLEERKLIGSVAQCQYETQQQHRSRRRISCTGHQDRDEVEEERGEEESPSVVYHLAAVELFHLAKFLTQHNQHALALLLPQYNNSKNGHNACPENHTSTDHKSEESSVFPHCHFGELYFSSPHLLQELEQEIATTLSSHYVVYQSCRGGSTEVGSRLVRCDAAAYGADFILYHQSQTTSGDNHHHHPHQQQQQHPPQSQKNNTSSKKQKKRLKTEESKALNEQQRGRHEKHSEELLWVYPLRGKPLITTSSTSFTMISSSSNATPITTVTTAAATVLSALLLPSQRFQRAICRVANSVRKVPLVALVQQQPLLQAPPSTNLGEGEGREKSSHHPTDAESNGEVLCTDGAATGCAYQVVIAKLIE